MGVSPDRMLQGRLFACHDAHLYRIGTNYQQLPVNRSRSPVHDYQRDGSMRFDGNAGSVRHVRVEIQRVQVEQRHCPR